MTATRTYRRSTLVTRLGSAKKALDRAQATYDRLADMARGDLPPGTHVEGNTVVTISPNRTWDKEKALENHGRRICSMQVDLKLARFRLTGEEFESFYVEGPPKVAVKVVE